MELCVLIQIADRLCAVRAIDVQAVMELDEITPVPAAPAHILGLSTKRSQTLTVLDCRQIAGLQPHPSPNGARAIVVEIDGHAYALLVDRIKDVEEARSEPTELGGGFGASWTDIAEGMIETEDGPALLLNILKVVSHPNSPKLAA